METITETPKIYVGTYSKYNNGSINGQWIELTSDKEAFYETCKELHADEVDPELMFQDFENFPKNLYSESDISKSLINYMEILESGDISKQILDDYIAEFDFNESTSLNDILDVYVSSESFSDFCYEMAQEMIPSDASDFLTRYFDYEMFEKDMSCDYTVSENGHIFRNF